MVKFGMTPIQAIQAATINAAQLLKWQDNIGSIKVGKYADLVAVEVNPLEDISSLESVAFVMKGGVVYKQ
jgi:imidazolonepropionase-like amidohydrolase